MENSLRLAVEWEQYIQTRKEGLRLCTAYCKLWREGDKLRNEGAELHERGGELGEEGCRLYAEGDRLYTEGNRLYTESEKLQAEAQKKWKKAVIAAYGKCKIKWWEKGCKVGNSDMYMY